jgi:hypothetical protein
MLRFSDEQPIGRNRDRDQDRIENPLDRDGRRPSDPCGHTAQKVDEDAEVVVRYEDSDGLHWLRGTAESSTSHGARIAVEGADTVIRLSRASHAGGGYFDLDLADAELFCVDQLSERFLERERSD